MMNFSRYQIVAGISALAMISSGILQAETQDTLTPPRVPTEIKVPDGNVPFLQAGATGTQNYACMYSPEVGYSWKFVAPQATLFTSANWLNGDLRQQIITHFLSSDPKEKDTPRATWQGSFDTSVVWGSVSKSSTDPEFVAPGAIPWLLLEQVGTQRGPTGGDLLTQTTFIQRINTHGGIAPTIPCSERQNAGVVMLVPYTADYVFFKKSDRN